jgi:hypothetical protein
MMTPEQRAEIFTQALAQTGDVVAAFRLVDHAARRTACRKMPPERLAELRAARAAGRKLSDLAADFGITEPYACRLCRGVVVAPPPPVEPVPPGAAEIVRIIGTVLFTLQPGWERIRRLRWTPPAVAAAQKVAVLAMVGEGITWQQIGQVIGRCQSSVGATLEMARRDPSVRQMKTVVREILAREAAPIAVPVPDVAQHRAA